MAGFRGKVNEKLAVTCFPGSSFFFGKNVGRTMYICLYYVY